MRELTYPQVIAINKAIVDITKEPFAIINENNIKSAIGNQYQSYELEEQAVASVFKSIIINHGFQNGNKRTAVACLDVFALRRVCDDTTLTNLTLEIASEGGSKISVNKIANVLFGLKLDESLLEDLSGDDFWNLRNIDLDIEGNLIQDGATVNPISKEELANKFAVSVEHADRDDFKSKEEIEKIAQDTGALRIMFFYLPGENYSGEYSLLYGDEEVAKKVGKEYTQHAYARFDEDGNYHEEILEETK